ncbi:MAG: hypothetical protein HFF13_08805 [Angelakisella sp.]|nr:hypothetical protein [Angelakisella sp.]MCI9667337.1 hypothetical protein [Angelakisella sp.]
MYFTRSLPIKTLCYALAAAGIFLLLFLFAGKEKEAKRKAAREFEKKRGAKGCQANQKPLPAKQMEQIGPSPLCSFFFGKDKRTSRTKV